MEVSLVKPCAKEACLYQFYSVTIQVHWSLMLVKDMCWPARQFSEEGSHHPSCRVIFFIWTIPGVKDVFRPDFITGGSKDCLS